MPLTPSYFSKSHQPEGSVRVCERKQALMGSPTSGIAAGWLSSRKRGGGSAGIAVLKSTSSLSKRSGRVILMVAFKLWEDSIDFSN